MLHNRFRLNRYSVIYFDIIAKAQSESRKKEAKNSDIYVYYERHHILPRSLGGDNTKDNLVLLTAREHLLCHWLLTKMCLTSDEERKMINAYYKMACVGPDHKRLPAKLYELIRKRKAELGHSDATKEKMREAWNKRDRTFSEEVREKFRQGKLNSSYESKPLSEEHKAKLRKPKSEETKIKMSKAQKGKQVSEETREKIRQANLGKVYSEDLKKKMSEVRKGKPKSEATKAKMRKAALRRWNGDFTPE